mmetsp:Transcript_3428/g.5778  ORF Transcript_3428/g.5778 Transcript_3428/m.5778 type:complete len:246 (-) Transcript_3428:1599-2336(-)
MYQLQLPLGGTVRVIEYDSKGLHAVLQGSLQVVGNGWHARKPVVDGIHEDDGVAHLFDSDAPDGVHDHVLGEAKDRVLDAIRVVQQLGIHFAQKPVNAVGVRQMPPRDAHVDGNHSKLAHRLGMKVISALENNVVPVEDLAKLDLQHQLKQLLALGKGLLPERKLLREPHVGPHRSAKPVELGREVPRDFHQLAFRCSHVEVSAGHQALAGHGDVHGGPVARPLRVEGLAEPDRPEVQLNLGQDA